MWFTCHRVVEHPEVEGTYKDHSPTSAPIYTSCIAVLHIWLYVGALGRVRWERQRDRAYGPRCSVSCALGEHELRCWGRVAARAPAWTLSLREPISLSLIAAVCWCVTQGLKHVGGRKKKPKGGKCMGSVLADSI